MRILDHEQIIYFPVLIVNQVYASFNIMPVKYKIKNTQIIFCPC